MTARPLLPVFLLAAALPLSAAPAGRAARSGPAIQVLTRDGQLLEGTSSLRSITLKQGRREQEVPLREVLSLHLADPASPREAESIRSGLVAVAGTDRKARDGAVAELTDIGLPVLSPLLATYRDTDVREPAPLYRLFARIIPGHADGPDRTLDLLRLEDGRALRGDWLPAQVTLTTADGKTLTLAPDQVRRIAVRRPEVRKTFDVHALRHTTPIDFLDTGVALSDGSRIRETATGWTRLDFNVDGWSSDPDGLRIPGPNYKTNLVDGFPFGALVGRVGATGERWKAGRRFEGGGLGRGRLFFAVNDNPHWQNNVGSYRVELLATDAYDLGDPQ